MENKPTCWAQVKEDYCPNVAVAGAYCEEHAYLATITMESTKDRLLRALSTMDEFASYTVADNDNGEAEELAEAHKALFDHLNNL